VTVGYLVAPFDAAAAQQAGNLMASRQKKGRPGELRDTTIAGIVLAHHATLATRNIAHFGDLSVPVINPWLDVTVGAAFLRHLVALFPSDVICRPWWIL
jgi:hypothetical protein